MTEIEQTLFTRRSIRRYARREVERALTERVLQAAMFAPSAHNRQPWRFAVIERGETKARLARAMGARLRADLERDGVPEAAIARDVARSFQRLTRAPVLVLLCLSMRDMDDYPDARRAQNERVMAIQSTAMAAQNLLLAAHAMGLGACWMCAPLFVPRLVRETLGLPQDWEPQGLITLGYPAEEKTKTREPLHSRVIFLD